LKSLRIRGNTPPAYVVSTAPKGGELNPKRLDSLWFILVFLAGCKILPNANYSIVGDIDHSLPVTASVVSEGVIIYNPGKTQVDRTNNITIDSRVGRESLKNVALESVKVYGKKTPNRTYFNVDTVLYRIRSTIRTANNAIEPKLDIQKLFVHNSEAMLVLIVKQAESKNVSFLMNDWFDARESLEEWPVWFGRMKISGASYNIYLVTEHEIKADIEDAEPEYDKMGLAFFRNDQKFQIVDEQGVVVAELKGENYEVYNTIPNDLIDEIKLGIGFLYEVKNGIIYVFEEPYPPKY
jgi:hypothetical protein